MLDRIKKMEEQLGMDSHNLAKLTEYQREYRIEQAVGEFIDKSARQGLSLWDKDGRTAVLEKAVNAKILAGKPANAKMLADKATVGFSKEKKADVSPTLTRSELKTKHSAFARDLKAAEALLGDARSRNRATSKETETPQPASSFDKNPLVADAQRRVEVNDLEKNRKE